MFKMDNIYKLFLSFIFTVFIGFSAVSYAEPAAVPAAQTANCDILKAQEAKPLDIVKEPASFLNKTIVMNGVFDKFSTLGLDYKKALRPSADYITFLIQRDDVVDHNVPLSEMKLFIKRDYAEKFIDLDTGDKIEIIGKVFSTALGDVWIDVDKITVLKKAKAQEETKK